MKMNSKIDEQQISFPNALNTSESSDFNSLFLINNEFPDFLVFEPETNDLSKQNTHKKVSLNRTFPSEKEEVPKKPVSKLISPQKISLKRPSKLTSDYLFEMPAINNPKEKVIKTERNSQYERYKLLDSNVLLRSLKKTLQKTQKSPIENRESSLSPTLNECSEDFPEKLHAKPLKSESKSMLEAKDFSEKTQEETNIIEKNLKESRASSLAEQVLSQQINEIEGLETYLESNQNTFAQIRLPINLSFINKKTQNETLWNHCFEVETQTDQSFLIIKAKNSVKFMENIVDLRVRNATNGIKNKEKYHWSFYEVVDNRLFNGVMVLALDRISGLMFNLLMINYEKIELINLYEDIYRVLTLYVLSSQAQTNSNLNNINSFINITDVYVTEYMDFLENRVKFRLWVVLEPFSLSFSEVLAIRKSKGFPYSAKELLDLYSRWAADLYNMNEKCGIIYKFDENQVFFSQSDNKMKIIDVSFLFMIKNKLPHAVTTMNSLIEKARNVTDFQEDFRIQNFFKSFHIHLDKILKEILSVSSSYNSRLAENSSIDFLKSLKETAKERSEEEELFFHGKLFRKNYDFKQSNERYKKLIVKYEMQSKNDMEIRYKIGMNFFYMGAFEKAKGLCLFLKEYFSKDPKQNMRKTLNILVTLAFIHQKANDLDGSTRYFEEILSLSKKFEGFFVSYPDIKPLITQYLGSISYNMANNLSHLKKSLKLFTDALQLWPQNSSLMLNLASINARLGNCEKSLGFFQEIENAEKTESLSPDKSMINRKLIFLENKSLVLINLKRFVEAKKLIEEAKALISKNQSLAINEQVKIQLYINHGILFDRSNNFYEALKKFKIALSLYKNIQADTDSSKKLLFGILNNLAGVYLKLGEFEQSQKYLSRCETVLISFDPLKEKTCSGIFSYNKGLLAKALGKNDEAIKHVENSLKIKRKFTEENNEEAINAMKLLLKLYLAVNNSEKALEYSEKLCELWDKKLKNQHKLLFLELKELADCLETSNILDEALKIYEKACVFINSEQITDSKRIEFFMKLANIYELNKNLEKSLEIYQKLVEIHAKNKEENVKILLDLYNKMVDCCKKLKKEELLRKFLLELESLHVIENSQNLLKKVGGKFLVSLKGGANKLVGKKIIPLPKNN